MRMLLLLISIGVLRGLSAQESERTDPSFDIVEVRLYYSSWDSQAGYRRNAVSIREFSNMTMVMRNGSYGNEFVAWLRLDEMVSTENVEEFNVAKDAKLVIDIFYSDGKIETFISNGLWLYSEDETLMRPVNSEFLCKFHFNDWNFGIAELESKTGGGCD